MNRLTPERFALGEQVNQHWTLTAETGTTLGDVMQPEFFANVASKLRPYDKIYARVDSGEWYAELLVVSCGRVWAKVIVLHSVDFVSKDIETTVADGARDYEVKYKGPHLKFCVIRNSDKEIIKDHLDTAQEAHAWLSSYLITT